MRTNLIIKNSLVNTPIIVPPEDKVLCDHRDFARYEYWNRLCERDDGGT